MRFGGEQITGSRTPLHRTHASTPYIDTVIELGGSPRLVKVLRGEPRHDSAALRRVGWRVTAGLLATAIVGLYGAQITPNSAWALICVIVGGYVVAALVTADHFGCAVGRRKTENPTQLILLLVLWLGLGILLEWSHVQMGGAAWRTFSIGLLYLSTSAVISVRAFRTERSEQRVAAAGEGTVKDRMLGEVGLPIARSTDILAKTDVDLVGTAAAIIDPFGHESPSPSHAVPRKAAPLSFSDWRRASKTISMASMVGVGFATVAVAVVASLISSVLVVGVEMVGSPDGVVASTEVSARPTPPVLSSGSGVSVGIIDVTAVSENERMSVIAAMFNDYFSAINVKDFDRALGHYDPNGVIDPSDPSHRAAFIGGMSAATDSDIVMYRIDVTSDLPKVGLRFRSHQSAGYGPKGREQETCTDWDVKYILTLAEGSYRILRAAEASSRPC